MKTGCLILGAGLSGLSAAYHLDVAGQNDWLMLEKAERAGGLCRSIRYEDGFTFDHSIHILYSSDPYATGLIKDLLEGNLSIQKRESWVYTYGAYTPYPWQANTFGLPAEVVKECLLGVIKATYEKGNAPAMDFEQWCFSTFGGGIARHFMVPYNRKLWAVDLKRMTDAWISDRVMTPSLDEVIEGAIRRQEKDFGPNAVFWYPERGGIEALPLGLLGRLDKKRISLATEVEKILWKKRVAVSSDGRRWDYERLVSSAPLPWLIGRMEPEAPPEAVEAAGRLERNTVYAINLTVKREGISPYHWVYFPEEKYVFHRISFPKNFSPHMAPPGWSSITVEVSSSLHRDLKPDEALMAKVVSGLTDAGVLEEGDVVSAKPVLVLNPAYIIYNHTHRGDVDVLHGFLRQNGIHPCGRFGDWEYLNMDHSILSGKRAAEEAIK